MILAVQNLKMSNSSGIKGRYGAQLFYMGGINNSSQATDHFTKSKSKVTFTGKQYPSGYYDDGEIETAKRFINQMGPDWKKTVKKEMKTGNFDLFAESHGLFHIFKIFGDDTAAFARLLGDALTWGGAEVLNLPEFAIRKAVDNSKTNEKVRRIAMLINDMSAENERAEKAEAIKANGHELSKIQYREEVSKIRNQIRSEFSDRLDLEQKGIKTEVPNCVMLMDEHDDLSKEIIQWTGETSDCNFVKLADQNNDTLQDKLWKSLEDAKKLFVGKDKTRTLINVERFEDLINPKTNVFENIEWLKDIMNRCSKDFGSTIIFNTKDISKLNNEAIQPQRVAAKILVAIKSMK